MSERVVTSDTQPSAAVGASSLIMTIVWSVVLLVALAVGIIILVHYHIL
jgi:hypothetical protein